MAEQKPNLDDVKKLEDEVLKCLETWSPLHCATAYLVLNASGMNLESAKKIRRKAGATQ